MKSFLIAASMALGVANGPLAAEPVGVLGAWAVDVTRLPMPPEARPRRVTITFSDEASGRLRTRVEVVDPAGVLRLAEGVTPLDGSATPVTSNFEADMSATLMPRPEMLIMQLAKGGKPASTRIYTVSPDGTQMTETVAHFSPDGQPVLRRNHFSRVR